LTQKTVATRLVRQHEHAGETLPESAKGVFAKKSQLLQLVVGAGGGGAGEGLVWGTRLPKKALTCGLNMYQSTKMSTRLMALEMEPETMDITPKRRSSAYRKTERYHAHPFPDHIPRPETRTRTPNTGRKKPTADTTSGAYPYPNSASRPASPPAATASPSEIPKTPMTMSITAKIATPLGLRSLTVWKGAEVKLANVMIQDHE
jgi:hypothetical protein